MTREQISLGGVPVIGFGDASGVKLDPGLAAPLVGFSIGGLAGAAIGAMVGKGPGAAVGALICGIGGGVITYAATAKAESSSPQTMASAWRRLSEGDPILEGQPLFIAISSPNGLDPAVITSISTSLANWHSNRGQAYPPGSSGPVDSPADDTRGPGAYRMTAVAGDSDRFSTSDISKALPPVPLTIEAWVKK